MAGRISVFHPLPLLPAAPKHGGNEVTGARRLRFLVVLCAILQTFFEKTLCHRDSGTSVFERRRHQMAWFGGHKVNFADAPKMAKWDSPDRDITARAVILRCGTGGCGAAEWWGEPSSQLVRRAASAFIRQRRRNDNPPFLSPYDPRRALTAPRPTKDTFPTGASVPLAKAKTGPALPQSGWRMPSTVTEAV